MQDRLTLRDKISLIYSLAGSQNRIASFVGISRYTVAKILYPPEMGGNQDDSRVKPETRASINAAFSIYKDFVKQTATKQGLPFLEQAPLYLERLPLSTIIDGKKYIRVDKSGEPILGDRVAAIRTHWISDAMRRAWIIEIHRTGFFNNLSIRSTVDLSRYFDEGEEKLKGKRGESNPNSPNFDRRWAFRAQLKRKLELGIETGYIFTPYQALDKNFNPNQIADAITRVLRARHEHCALNLADEFLLQVDSRKHGSQSQYKANQRSARKTARGNKRGDSRKQAKAPPSVRATRKKKAS